MSLSTWSHHSHCALANRDPDVLGPVRRSAGRLVAPSWLRTAAATSAALRPGRSLRSPLPRSPRRTTARREGVATSSPPASYYWGLDKSSDSSSDSDRQEFSKAGYLRCLGTADSGSVVKSCGGGGRNPSRRGRLG